MKHNNFSNKIGPQKDWYHNEFKQLGTDYHNLTEVEDYDKRMNTFRNIDEEHSHLISQLALSKEHTLLDIGCGTGAFAFTVAQYCKKVLAIDISKQMIDFALQKIERLQSNDAESIASKIIFENAGFLTFEAPHNSIDRIVSVLSLHHLPDFWKIIALKRVHTWLTHDGLFVLRDVIFSFPAKKYENEFEKWISTGKTEAMRKSMAAHIAKEFSTTLDIMKLILKEAGFEIIQITSIDNFITEITCLV